MGLIEGGNKRIAQNTLLLYFRMLFMMVISLYTSRVILQVLGVEDYGIYSVVGGLVSMFSLISNSLSNCIGRFIAFEIGRNDLMKLKKTFSVAVSIYIILALVTFVAVEAVAVWFLNTKMNIAKENMIAANWVLQFSLLTFIVNLISIPYNATIIAHERMSIFAYISIFEAISKLVVVYLLLLFSHYRLILYVFLLFLLSLFIRIIYGIYCKRQFEECSVNFIWDKPIVLEMFNMEDVKNRLDRYKKRCSYSDCLDEMLGYFELTGVEPRLGQTPPVATFVSTMKSGNAVLLKRMDDLIKILRNIEINKIDPILHSVEDGFFSDRSNTPEVGLSVSEEELYQVIQMNEKLKSDIRNKDILIQKLRSDAIENNVIQDIISDIEELLSDRILSSNKDGFFLLSREHRDQLIRKIRTYINV